MKLAAKVLNESTVEIVVTMTATRGEWHRLIHQLPGDWPAWKLANMLSGALGFMSRELNYAAIDEEKE